MWPADARRATSEAIEAELEKNPFYKGNTAGGRRPPYKPEYARQAKELCKRGATLDQLAEFFGVSPKTVRFWQISQGAFNKACKLMPACLDHVRRTVYESALGQTVVVEKTVEAGGQTQIAKTTTISPGNLAAAKCFIVDQIVPVEGEMAQLLRELQGTRIRPKYRAPDGTMMTEREHIALGGSPDEGEIDWSKKSREVVSQSMCKLIELRKEA